jgi:putative ABC transport system permease protein
MSAPVRPPRWAEWILQRSLKPGISRDGVLGDLEEELRLRAGRGSAASARHWYGRQAVVVAARMLATRALSVRAGRANAGDRSVGLRTLADDVVHAFRSLRHAPVFVLLAAFTLALGVGATTAIFSVVDGILIRPLPYPESDRLVTSKLSLGDEELDNHSEPEFLDLMDQKELFAAVAAYRMSEPLLGTGSEPQRVHCLLVTASVIDVLRIEPMKGRFFTAEEDRPDAERVAVLSHGLWLRAFAADPAIIGKTVLFENLPHTVVGVMPRGFSFPGPGVDVVRPLRIDRANPVARNNHYLRVVARVAPDLSFGQLAERLEMLGARSTATHPEFYSEALRFRAVPLHEDLVGDVRSPLVLLMAAVGLVLLIAAVNAASLFLARGQGRRGEIAVRTALGAPRGRVASQLLAESLLVSMVAGALGALLAWGGVSGLRRLAPTDLPRLEQVVVDGRVLLFGLTVTLITGVVFGLAPVAQAWRSDVRDVLAAGGRGGMGSRQAARFRRALVITQLALALVLALGAGLVIRSFAELRRADLGFDAGDVLLVPLSPHSSAVAPDADAVRFYRLLEERIAALPGVEVVGSSLAVPLSSGHSNFSIQVEGREVASIGESPSPGIEWATPGYFHALRIPLRRGRLFTAADDENAHLVAVIGEATARMLWPGEDALGKRLRMFNPASPWMEVVGIVADVKHYGVREEPSAMLYIPHLQGFRSGVYSPANLTVFVRSASSDPAALAGAVQRTVRALEPRMPIGEVRTMDDVVRAALAADRFTLLLLAGFALGALLLAAVGVYGVVAETVTSRTREIGLRMAVGAGRTRILRQVLRESLVLAGWGAGIGLAGGLLLARLLGTVLYEVSPFDPWAYVVAGPLVAGVVAIASLVPAVRAARLDPMHALRSA